MSDDAEFQAEIVAEFLTEAAEVLSRLERDLVAVDGGRDPAEVLASTFRAFHTLKGTSGFLGFSNVGGLAHAAEDLLAAIRDGAVAWTRQVTDLLLEALDALRAMVDTAAETSTDGSDDHADLVSRLRLQAAAPAAPTPTPTPTPTIAAQPPLPSGERTSAEGPSTPAPTPGARPPPPSGEKAGGEGPAAEASTLRVPVSVLDRLMSLVGELVLARNQLLCHEEVHQDAGLTETSQRIHQLTTGLQESVMKARMQPIDTVFSRLPRVARDAAQATGKQARLVVAGAETELDKTLLEAIKDPLTHVVRNAVDHGLESPARRAAASKPAEGTVSVRAFHDGGQVVVEVEDDGGGVNLERVRRKAVQNGLLDAAQAAALSEEETIELLFRPGFSTAEAVTQISGRGVGMDVVRTNVERIGGSVELESRAGCGTTVRLRVPLTLVIVPSLIVSSAGQRYALPQAAVVELVRVAPEREAQLLADVQGTPLLRLRGSLLPLVDLGVVLRTGPSRRSDDGARSVVVLSAAGHRFGLLVEDVADTEETVVKPLGRELQALGAYSGATVRGDGRVALVLDVLGLARRSGVLGEGTERARALAAGPAAAAEVRRPYLLLRARDDGRIAIPLADVTRLEELDAAAVERVGGQEAIQYRGAILPLVRLAAALPERRRAPRGPSAPPAGGERLHVVVHRHEGRAVGLVVESVLDVVEEAASLDPGRARPGVSGCAVLQGRITEVLDTDRVLATALGQEAAHG